MERITPTVAIDLNNLGSAWDDLGDAKKAITYYERALAIDEKTYGKDHPTGGHTSQQSGFSMESFRRC